MQTATGCQSPATAQTHLFNVGCELCGASVFLRILILWKEFSEENLLHSTLMGYHLSRIKRHRNLLELHASECSLTVALSKTLMEFSSATFLFRRASSSVHSGSVSHFPKTTKSMSLRKKQMMRYDEVSHLQCIRTIRHVNTLQST